MKRIILKKLALHNWRAQNKEVVFYDDETTISGRNRSGKSSVFNAFLWTLTGYDSSGRSNFELFDNTIEQTPENSQTAITEVVLEVDGEQITFRREAEIGWTRKRNTKVYERSGSDNYHYFIDDIEHTAKLYNERIESIFNAPMDKIRIMLNITHFLSLEWKVMRKHLNDIIGTLSDSDFTGDYSQISEMLSKYSTEALKEMYKSQMRPIKADIAALPTTIQTLYDSVGEKIHRQDIECVIAEAKKVLATIDEKIADANKAMQPYYDKRANEEREIARLNDEIQTKRREYDLNEPDGLINLRKKLATLNRENAKIVANNEQVAIRKRQLSRNIEQLTHEIKWREETHEKLSQKNKECKGRIFTEDLCPYCGQTLPSDKLEDSKKQFEEERKREHARIVEDGKRNRADLEKAREDLSKAKFELESLSEETLINTKDIELEIAEMSVSKLPFEETDTYNYLNEKIADIRANMTDIPSDVTAELRANRSDVLETIELYNKQLGKADAQDETYRKAICKQAQLEEETTALAKLEGMYDAVVAYERERAEIISTRVNRQFKFIKVEMTEMNKSGDIIDTCKILDAEGVSVAVTNTASRIISGVDMALAFANYYDVSVPCFVDNAEAINESNFPYVPSQVIKIKATEENFGVKGK